eukprot:9500273-Pyramimonas_sp.AAC.1
MALRWITRWGPTKQKDARWDFPRPPDHPICRRTGPTRTVSAPGAGGGGYPDGYEAQREESEFDDEEEDDEHPLPEDEPGEDVAPPAVDDGLDEKWSLRNREARGSIVIFNNKRWSTLPGYARDSLAWHRTADS